MTLSKKEARKDSQGGVPASSSVLPGNPVANSQSGQPIMVALDLLGRRWALRILWYLRDGEKRSSRAIQNACEISSPNVLTSRLKELRDAGIVVLQKGEGYGLTELGIELLISLRPLAQWADQWAKSVGRDDLACYEKSQR